MRIKGSGLRLTFIITSDLFKSCRKLNKQFKQIKEQAITVEFVEEIFIENSGN
jgi:hypothetical protein